MSEVQTRNSLYGFDYRVPDKRRVDPENRTTYEIQSLWQRSHEIINLAAKGYKNVEIAEILNIHPQTVSQTLNSELGQRKLSEIRLERDNETKALVEKVRVLTKKALQIYHEVLDDDSGEATLKDKKNVADTVVLELSGLRVPTKVQSASFSATLTAEDLTDLKKRAIDAGKASGLIIDIECEDETKQEATGN